ncbi:hypothetical protein ASPCAL02637 [Aspergillus calidoustus]|uniref:Uncharacterized protein n=1 Tax=Aspergillus calidoustus TaxID=454130 RepID=A0A0U5CN20_ASPCI|nr:hypothetical protein ASPCAL02637 [Aspergillus calidoustus]
MFVIPFVTVLREGLEPVVFVGLNYPAYAFPLPVFGGIAAGVVVRYVMYWGGNSASLQPFLVISTCLLYLMAAGLLLWGVEPGE